MTTVTTNATHGNTTTRRCTRTHTVHHDDSNNNNINNNDTTATTTTTTPSSSSSSSLISSATYETKDCHYSYGPEGKKVLTVPLVCATVTRTHGSIVSDAMDSTGVMVWPASHVLCQFLTTCILSEKDDNHDEAAAPQHEAIYPFSPRFCCFLGRGMVELGCGCGLVSLTAVLAQRHRQRQQEHRRELSLEWVVCTDGNAEEALALTRQNFRQNNLIVEEEEEEEKGRNENGRNGDGNDEHENKSQKDKQQQVEEEPTKQISSPHVWIRRLQWGHVQDLARLEQQVSTKFPESGVDTVVAADVVYPATCQGNTLHQLLQTAKSLISCPSEKKETRKKFILAFCSRDGYKTPWKLVQAASDVGWRIQVVPWNAYLPLAASSSTIPPLMNAQVLILTLSPQAAAYNARLGLDETCPVFPGLRQAQQRAEKEAQEAPEEWIMPFAESSDDDESGSNN